MQGKLDEAEPLALRCLAISVKTLGPDHKQVAGSCNNLAELYQVRASRSEGSRGERSRQGGEGGG